MFLEAANVHCPFWVIPATLKKEYELRNCTYFPVMISLDADIPWIRGRKLTPLTVIFGGRVRSLKLPLRHLYLSIYGSRALCWTLVAFQSLNLYTVGRIPWMGDQPVARPLPTHITIQTQNKRTQNRHPCLEWDSNLRSSGRRRFIP
jgi:hypothetical protein